MGACLEFLGHVRIHCDHEVPLVCHFSIAIFDLISNPSLELISEDCSTDIDDPLLRNLLEIRLIWQVQIGHWLVTDELQDLFDGQALVLRDMDGLDVIIVHPGPFAADDVLEEVDGDIVWKKSWMRRAFQDDLP